MAIRHFPLFLFPVFTSAITTRRSPIWNILLQYFDPASIRRTPFYAVNRASASMGVMNPIDE